MLDVRRLRLLRELKLRGTLAGRRRGPLLQPVVGLAAAVRCSRREVGVPLLAKVGRRVQLTPQAERARRARRRHARRSSAPRPRSASSLTEVRGTVRLAVFQSAALAHPPGGADDPARRVPRAARRGHRARAGDRARSRSRRATSTSSSPSSTRATPDAHRPDLDRVVLGGDAIGSESARVDPGATARRSRRPDVHAAGSADRDGLGDGARRHRIAALGRAALPRGRLRARRALRDRRPEGAHPADPRRATPSACCPTSCGPARRRRCAWSTCRAIRTARSSRQRGARAPTARPSRSAARRWRGPWSWSHPLAEGDLDTRPTSSGATRSAMNEPLVE